MKTKLVEIRDDGTCISAIAIKLGADDNAQRALLAHAGYGTTDAAQSDHVALLRLHDFDGATDPFKQTSRTMRWAHLWIRDHFDELRDGDVVDVEFVRGVNPAAKKSEVQPIYGAICNAAPRP